MFGLKGGEITIYLSDGTKVPMTTFEDWSGIVIRANERAARAEREYRRVVAELESLRETRNPK